MRPLFFLPLWAFSTTARPQTPSPPSTWTSLSPIPAGPIHEHAVAALDNTRIITVGGMLERGGVIDSVYIYTLPPTNSWKKVASLPITINHANAAVVDGRLYILGGMTGAAWNGTPRSWVYDPSTDKWTALANMPATDTPRGSAVMGVYGKTIWLASGKTKSGGESVTTVSAYDTVAAKWLVDIPAKAKNIPEGRDHGGGGVVGSKFYQLGGSLGAIENRKDTVFVLDLEDLNKGWVTAKGKMPTPRRGFATGIVGTKIYTFGGEGNPDKTYGGVFKDVEVYDTVTDTWAALGSMKLPRHGSAAAVINGTIYIPGGGTAMGTPATAAFDAFTP